MSCYPPSGSGDLRGFCVDGISPSKCFLCFRGLRLSPASGSNPRERGRIPVDVRIRVRLHPVCFKRLAWLPRARNLAFKVLLMFPGDPLESGIWLKSARERQNNSECKGTCLATPRLFQAIREASPCTESRLQRPFDVSRGSESGLSAPTAGRYQTSENRGSIF